MKDNNSSITSLGRMPLLSSCLVFCLAVTGCGSDDGPALQPIKPQLPAAESNPVKQIRHQGDVTSCYDWKFTYDQGRLVNATGLMRSSDAQTDGTYQYTSSLAFSPSTVQVSNSSGEKTQLQLNALGHIKHMSVNKNQYDFEYIDGRLVKWEKTAVESSMGQILSYKSSATIEYMNGNFSKITYMGPDGAKITISFTASDLQNRNGVLPELVGKELGCLGFEHLYYAGLLGRSSSNLVKDISYTNDKDASQNFDTSFEYSIKNGNVVLCNYHTPTGGVASVSYEY